MSKGFPSFGLTLCRDGWVGPAGKRFDDATVSPVIRQTLLHWGYELTERDFHLHVAKAKKK